jgi:hypothetical protein
MIHHRRLALGVSAVALGVALPLSAHAMASAGHSRSDAAVYAGAHTNRKAAAPGGASAPGPSTPPNIYTIAASSFAPDGLHTTTEDYFNQWDPSTLSNTDGGRCFNAGLALPNGATITFVRIWFTESSTAMYFELNRQQLSTHGATLLVSADTPTQSTPTYTSFGRAVRKNNLVNTNYAYSVGVCPSGSTTFSGVQIFYTG